MPEGYLIDNEHKEVIKENESFYLQTYRGDHKNEYTLFNDHKILHYKNGLLVKSCSIKNGKIDGGVFVYNNGCSKYLEKPSSSNETEIRVLNARKGFVKEIIVLSTKTVIYRGGVDDNGKRRGKGFEFDRKTGSLKLEGFWINDIMKRITRIFEGNRMTEFNNSNENLDVTERHAVYIGGYFYDKEENMCYRNGIGYLINEKGLAYSRGEWNKGNEITTSQLRDGWFNSEEDPLLMYDPQCEDLIIPAGKFKAGSVLNLNQFRALRNIDMQEHNFCNVQHVNICGIDTLETIKIGNDSFCNNDRADRMNRTFSIMNCINLRIIKIGLLSFRFFSGAFELSNLPSLESIQFGEIGSGSCNFSFSKFIVKGMF